MKRILEGSQKSLLTVSLMAAFLTLSACGSDDDDIGSGVGDNVVAPVDGDTCLLYTSPSPRDRG